jgi:hypothetical protein
MRPCVRGIDSSRWTAQCRTPTWVNTPSEIRTLDPCVRPLWLTVSSSEIRKLGIGNCFEDPCGILQWDGGGGDWVT